MPFISICIPAFKRVEFLRRLLDSIAIQTFTDYEVIITDDSPGDEVLDLCAQYQNELPLFYYKNPIALGTPENWNEAIRRSNGEWIKLMHDDDWFDSEKSLAVFAEAVKTDSAAIFFYCTYNNVPENKNTGAAVRISSFRRKKLESDPFTLIAGNVVGPPSVTLVRNNKKEWYDKSLKWLVDVEYYIRCLKDSTPVYIDQVLVNVGINKDQVTNSSFRVPSVEIPEHFYFLKKTGTGSLKNIIVYDAWWRLFRNLGIKNKNDLVQLQTGDWPDIIDFILKDVNKLPAGLIRAGVVSKTFMTLSYLRNRNKIK